jgi:hypothetical protein
MTYNCALKGIRYAKCNISDAWYHGLNVRIGRRKTPGMPLSADYLPVCLLHISPSPRRKFFLQRTRELICTSGFKNALYLCCTGGTLAARGGLKAARNNAIACVILLAVIEGVGIAFTRMLADNTRLEVPPPPPEATLA